MQIWDVWTWHVFGGCGGICDMGEMGEIALVTQPFVNHFTA